MRNELDKHLVAYQGQYLYEFDNQIILNWYPKRIIESSQPDQSFLEYGLGHGITTNIFSKFFRSHTVIDGSPAVIRHFHLTYPECKAQIREGFFETYLTSERFDILSLGFVLEHVEDPRTVLSHARKLLSDSGVLYIAVPNAEVMNRRLGIYAGDLQDILALSEHDHICGHKRYYTETSLTQDIVNSGFKVVKKEGIYLKPLSTNQMIQLALPEKYIESLCRLGVEYPELSCAMLFKCELQRRQ